MERGRGGILVWAFGLLAAFVAAADAADVPQLGKNPTAEVVAALTREEKVQLVTGTGMRIPGMPAAQQAPAVGDVKTRVPGAAGNTFGVPRLGIPSLTFADGPAGVRIAPKRKGDESRSLPRHRIPGRHTAGFDLGHRSCWRTWAPHSARRRRSTASTFCWPRASTSTRNPARRPELRVLLRGSLRPREGWRPAFVPSVQQPRASAPRSSTSR